MSEVNNNRKENNKDKDRDIFTTMFASRKHVAKLLFVPGILPLSFFAGKYDGSKI